MKTKLNDFRFVASWFIFLTLPILHACNSAVEEITTLPISDKGLENNSGSEHSPIARYYFDESPGSEVIIDSSGLTPPVNLTIQNPTAVSWLENGLAINKSTIIISDRNQNTANRIVDALRSSNELTVELWMEPENITQSGPARIVSLSIDYGNRNLTIGQEADKYILCLRTSTSNTNGKLNTSRGEINPITTDPGTVTRELTHLVLTWDTETAKASYFINGSHAASVLLEGDFSTWSDRYPLLIANEAIDGRTWLGSIYFLAIYDCAIEDAEIAKKYNNGVPIKN